tara:strand:- start:92 stop:310 length:219 start_codon:yes stop_codon:yes gene_type:complete
MKESTLLEMQKKIKAMTNVIKGLMNEFDYLTTLSIGTLETIKQMPDYEKALDKVKEKANKEKEDGVKQQDTK